VTATPRRRLALLAAAVVAYALAAWSVAPGFYDGIAPPQPYRWVLPPPQFKSTNQQPLPGRGAARVASNGVVDPGSVFTQDNQAAISFVPGAFVPPTDHSSQVTIDIKPVSDFPDPGAVHVSTNVYCMTANSTVASGKDVLVTLQFSDQLPAPSDVYQYEGDGPWRKIGSTGSAAPFFISARATTLGCFAAGYPASATQAQGARVSGGQVLPVVVALAVLVVVLAGVPLAVLRRRRGADEDEEDDEEER
jgi:hypothetical protein